MHKYQKTEVVACAKIEDIIFSVAKASPCSVTESDLQVINPLDGIRHKET